MDQDFSGQEYCGSRFLLRRIKVSDQGFFQEPVEMRENLWYNKSYALKDRGGSYNGDNQD